MEVELPCLANWITFKYPCAGEEYVRPLSSLHWEDLPGFSTVSLAAVEPGKYLDAKTYAQEKLHTAGLMILDRLRNYLEPYVAERGPVESGHIGTFTDASPLAGDAAKRGVRIRVDGGAMLVPLISKVWLKSSTAISDLVVKVKDGTQILEFPCSVEADVETEVWIHYEARSKSVDVYIEDVRFTPHTGSTEGTSYFTSCNDCSGHARYLHLAGGGLLDDTEGTALQGMRAEVTLVCSLLPVACVLLKRFKWAVLFQAGILILQEWGATSRTNYFSIHSKEWAVNTMEEWNTIELPRAFKTHASTLASYVSQIDPECLNCGTGASYTHGTG